MTTQARKAARDFKKAVTAAKNCRDMFWRSQAPELAFMLNQAIDQLKTTVKDPQLAVKALLDFYKRDADIFEHCDDSYGNVGDVFRITAAQTLVDFAVQCSNKDEIADQILALQEDSDYGVRDTLIDKISCFLDKRGVERLIGIIEQKAQAEKDITSQRTWLRMIESLACQIKDGALFERTRQRSWQGLNSNAYIDIAKVYFDAGDALTAYDRLQKSVQCGGQDQYEYTVLFRDVCRAVGKTDEADAAALKIFRGHRSIESLNELLAQIGEDKRAGIVDNEKQLIIADKELNPTDVLFLIAIGHVECAQEYILARRDQLDGDQYYSLGPLAEALENGKVYLAAVIVYRALLEGNLAKALSKYYSHGVRYLRKLDVLKSKIIDWRDIEPHDGYTQNIRQQHGNKPAFWAKYESKTVRVIKDEV